MDNPQLELEFKFLSSLEKVFPSSTLDATEITGISGIRGETLSFQIAYFRPSDRIYINDCTVAPVEGIDFNVYNVGLVPSLLPCSPDDPEVITSDPGIFPDPLEKIDPAKSGIRGKWNALWITATPGAKCKPGTYNLDITINYRPYVPSRPGLVAPNYEKKLTFPLTVADSDLLPQKLICTQWFYADCLASYYKVEPWSEAHWEILGNYMRDMTAHGINMLFTPLWTVPLDTAIGGERPTVQLLKIRKNGPGKYEFNFERLIRYFNLGIECGFKYFEFSHIFTQWGAGFTPKIVADVNGKEEKIFGWHVTADDPEYKAFLSALMPELIKLLKEMKLDKICRFHVSDEPSPDHFESYLKAVKLVEDLTPGFVKMDALSDVNFYRQGATKCPIPATVALKDFMPEDISERWVYYCGNWQGGVPNRCFGMTSSRNRILGVQLYVYGIAGFLHWGYNFYYSQLSRKTDINPWDITDADRSFYSGDCHLVYPGADGQPVPSIHYLVFHEALQDLRLLQTLEAKIGRDKVMELIHEGLDYTITMTDYPRSSEWLLGLHDKIVTKLQSHA